MQAARAVLQAADGTRQGVRWLALAVLAGLFVGMALWSLLTGLFALLFTIWFRDGLALMLGMLCSGLVGLIALVAVCYFTSEEYVMELLLKNRYSGPLIRRALADAQRILHK
jgi:inner membrane protein involved in colicin E2 resistance